MAIIKHLNVRNMDYSSALEYLTLEHDAKTGKPVTDEKGRPVMRNEYLLDGLLCDPYSFPEACQAANHKFDVRLKHSSIKLHHYIISLDPRDRDDNGLTPEKAHTMCVKYAKEHFPGHQTIVCTHPDGHHGTGNIHTHIVVNSLRIHDVPKLPYMTQRSDYAAGGHLRDTKPFLYLLKQDLMEICQEHGLYQLDITKPTAIRVTDREYRANDKNKNEEVNSTSSTRKVKAPGTRELHKSILRNAITEASETCGSYQELIEKLKSDYGISVKETRGVISYKCPDVSYWIRGRSLGTAFEKENLLSSFEHGDHILKDAYPGDAYQQIMENVSEHHQQVTQAKIQNGSSPDHDRRNMSGAFSFLNDNKSYPETRSVYDLLNTPTKFERAMMHSSSDLRRIIDPSSNAKAQQNKFYANRITAGNINQMANTLAYLKQNHIDSFDELDRRIDTLSDRINESQERYIDAKEKLKDVNEKIHYLGQAAANSKTYKTWLAINDGPSKAAYRLENAESIKLYEDARSHLKELFNGQDWPALKEMKAEKTRLLEEKNDAYYQGTEGRGELEKLKIVKDNVRIILEEREHGYAR